jgi:hypothetical protein
MRRKGSMSNLGSAVATALDRLGLGNKLREQLVIVKWAEVVGERIAGVSRPDRISDGILWVACKSSVWANELTLHKEHIKTELNKTVQRRVVKDIRFSSRGYRKGQAGDNPEPHKIVEVDDVSLTPDQEVIAAAVADKAKDDKLAEAIKKAVLVSIRREQAKHEESET